MDIRRSAQHERVCRWVPQPAPSLQFDSIRLLRIEKQTRWVFFCSLILSNSGKHSETSRKTNVMKQIAVRCAALRCGATRQCTRYPRYGQKRLHSTVFLGASSSVMVRLENKTRFRIGATRDAHSFFRALGNETPHICLLVVSARLGSAQLSSVHLSRRTRQHCSSCRRFRITE